MLSLFLTIVDWLPVIAIAMFGMIGLAFVSGIDEFFIATMTTMLAMLVAFIVLATAVHLSYPEGLPASHQVMAEFSARWPQPPS